MTNLATIFKLTNQLIPGTLQTACKVKHQGGTFENSKAVARKPCELLLQEANTEVTFDDWFLLYAS